MRCPRCHLETADPMQAFCGECGSPLRLADEPAAAPLRTTLDIDRRAVGPLEEDDPFAGFAPAGRAPGAAVPAPGNRGAGDLAALDRSGWDLGAGVPDAGAGPGPSAEPAPTVRAPATQRLAAADAETREIHLRRAASWRRAVAGVLDVLPFVVGGFALARSLARSATFPAPDAGLDGLLDLLARERVIVISVSVAVALALGVYATLAHALAGATLGKRLLGLRVVGPDGARPSLARSFARSVLFVLSAGLLGLGVLLAFFTRSGRALHDFLARTWVVERP